MTWVKGESGNPKGRPKGKTLKEFAREYLATLPDDEKAKYLKELPKDIVWRMAEGNPAQDLTNKGGKFAAIPIYGRKSIQGHNGDSKDIPIDEED